MKNKFLIFVVSFFIFVPPSKAYLCDNSTKVEYQEMAKNISVNYEYTESNDDVNFNIKISNIPTDFIVLDVTNKKEYYPSSSSSEILIENVSKNTSYRFDILKNEIACGSIVFYSHYVNIPAYNKYYKDAVCEGIEDYKLCSKWLNVTVSYDEWKNKIIEYKKSLNKKEDIKKEEEKTLIEKIIEFYSDYYMFILSGIIIVCCSGIYLYNKKHDLF